jgi:riboflavin synthase
MFTGLVSERGEVVSLRRQGGGAVLTVKARGAAGGAAVGDSIAVSGACLTVTGIKGPDVSFDLSEETLGSATLGSLRPGDSVNIEESLRADSKLGGHFVTGHVDAVGKIQSRTSLGDAWKYEIGAPPEVMDFLVEKGSVCVDGISLTVVDVLRDSFTLVIIPHTAEITTLGSRGPGDPVNLEADIIGKYVHRFLKRRKDAGSLMDTLKREGYVGAE